MWYDNSRHAESAGAVCGFGGSALKGLFFLIDDEIPALRFTRVSGNDAARIAPYFKLNANLSCDATPFNMLFWGEYYAIDIYCAEDALLWLMESELHKEGLCAGMPVCKEKDVQRYVDVMYRYFKEILKTPFAVSCIDSELDAVETVLKNRGVSFFVEELRDNADYLYSGEQLRTLSGKKFHQKKNMCNSFEKTYAGRFTYRALTSADCGLVLDFLSSWIHERPHEEGERQSLLYEYEGLRAFFSGDGTVFGECAGQDRFSAAQVKCGGVFIDGTLRAFTLGSYCESNKLAIIHIEKALSEYKGLYQFINREFLRNEMPEAVTVNREDDLGLEGLRQAKQSYHPVDFCKKYIIRETGTV